MEGYYTVQQASAILDIEGSVLRRRLERGMMQGERLHARLWLIPASEVERLQKEGPRKKPGPKPRRHPGA